jgi:hypothetical protein
VGGPKQEGAVHTPGEGHQGPFPDRGKKIFTKAAELLPGRLRVRKLGGVAGFSFAVSLPGPRDREEVGIQNG